MAYNANMNVADIRAGLLAGDFTAREVAEASFKRITMVRFADGSQWRVSW